MFNTRRCRITHCCKNRPTRLLVFARHLKIVLIGKAEGKCPLHPVNFLLKAVAGIPETKQHAGVLVQTRRRGEGRLADVVGMHRNLFLPEIYLAEDCCSSSNMNQVIHIGKRVQIWFSDQNSLSRNPHRTSSCHQPFRPCEVVWTNGLSEGQVMPSRSSYSNSYLAASMQFLPIQMVKL